MKEKNTLVCLLFSNPRGAIESISKLSNDFCSAVKILLGEDPQKCLSISHKGGPLKEIHIKQPINILL